MFLSQGLEFIELSEHKGYVCSRMHGYEMKCAPCPPPFDGITLGIFTEVKLSAPSPVVASSQPDTCSSGPHAYSPGLVHFLIARINKSPQSGEVPICFKTAVVTPPPKKLNLDRGLLSNYRPGH